MKNLATEKRIKELLATAPALVASDEGTHGGNRTYRIYETIRGERFGKTQYTDNNATDCTEEEASESTEGRLRQFPQTTKEIRTLAAELRKLERQLVTA